MAEAWGSTFGFNGRKNRRKFGTRDGDPMRKIVGWGTLILLGSLTLFETLILCLGQFGFDFAQGGPESRGLQYGWLALACKAIGLGISRRTGLLMIGGGLIDWTYSILLQMHGQHQSLGAALTNSLLDGAYVLLAVIYIVVTRRWWVRASRAEDKQEATEH